MLTGHLLSPGGSFAPRRGNKGVEAPSCGARGRLEGTSPFLSGEGRIGPVAVDHPGADGVKAMRFANDRCPVCGQHISGITEATHIYRGLTPAGSDEYEYDGRYLALPETQEPYLLANGNVLVECEAGHQWETALIHDVCRGVSSAVPVSGRADRRTDGARAGDAGSRRPAS